MFNLLVGYGDDDEIVPGDRMFEYTDDAVRDDLGMDYIPALTLLPTLSMPEIQDDSSGKVARIGTIARSHNTRWGQAFKFTTNLSIEPIPAETIRTLADKLEIDADRWEEFDRTHWAVKDVDLYQVLLEHQTAQRLGSAGSFHESGAVQFPVDTPRDSGLVAVMMPFAPEFDIVYETIRKAAEDSGLTCVRADDIWENDHVMGDVLSLLWQAQIVIADLTGRNTNVFYELGLAHALPRKTILITQDREDQPFDLRSIRSVEYGVGTAGRSVLRTELSRRLKTLIQQSPL
ncbi:MAG: hypothetical protein QM774_02410 [Gordonia sp. (in: high G+C Gram-positive bacteria)]|uniref:hypothetical protein n=1 Tax=Gordonia sp. (in: high G+C Gram-positive bacteria) TaxID=84139 RepID=UPI0039E41FCC